MRLSHPEIFKGVKLGMDYDKAMDTLLKNEGCEEINNSEDFIRYKISKFQLPFAPEIEATENFCQYSITSEIFAKPQLQYVYSNGVKVVGSAYLLFHSPQSFRYLTLNTEKTLGSDEFKVQKMLYGIPAIDTFSIISLVSMFDTKYGKGKGHETRVSEWIVGDLVIKLYKYKYGREIKFYDGEIREDDAWLVFALFEYSREILEKFEYEKTSEDGDVIGDKI